MKKTKLGYWAVSTMGLWIVVMGLILLGGYCLSDGKVSAGGGAWGWQLILFSVWIFLVAGVVTGWKHRGDDTYLAPISAAYRKPMFEAVGLQIVLGFLSFSILDGGVIAEIFGIALVAFWGGMAVLIARRRYAPSRVDLFLLRFGYLPVLVMAFFLVGYIWRWRGVEM